MQQSAKLDKSMKHNYFIVRHLVCVYSRWRYTIVARSTGDASCMRLHAFSWPGDRSLKKVAGLVRPRP